MAGFKSVGEWVDAYDKGQTFFTMIRKYQFPSVAQNNIWFDWTTVAGYPTGNFYASAPLVAARLDDGIRIPTPSVSPASQYLKSLLLTVSVSSTSGAYGNSMTHRLLDYLLYYPFIDMTAVGEEQVMDNTVTLPRYTDGKGVRMMIVSQSATTGNAGFTGTIKYINQDGVEKTTPAFAISAASFSGVVQQSNVSNGSNPTPFVQLATGDTGVRSVVSTTFTADQGGIAAIVLVRPLFVDATTDSSQRLSTGPVSYGSYAKKEFVIEQQPIKIEDGAFLGFISWIYSDSRYSTLVAGIETIWN